MRNKVFKPSVLHKASCNLLNWLHHASQDSTIELFVDEVNEKVDIDFGTAKHLHDGQAFILQLQQVLHGHTQQ